MKKLIGLLFLVSPVWGTNVSVINSTNDPVNVQVTGTVTTSAGPAVGTSTVTFNGVGQPVTSTSTIVVQSTVGVVSASPLVVTGSTVGIVGSISNTGFNVNNAPTVVQSTAAINGSTTAIVNAVGTQITVVSTGIPVTGAFFQASQPVTVSQTNGIPVTSTYTIITDTWPVNFMNQYQSLVKGFQASTGTTVQELKDTGRSYVVLVATGVAGVTSETLFTFSQNKQGVNTDNITSYTITNGKTLRIQGLYCSNRDGAATAASWTRAVIRHNTGGATIATSPKVFGIEVGNNAALSGGTGQVDLPFPDGIEIFGNGTQSIGVSHLDSATTNVVTCSLVGYEY